MTEQISEKKLNVDSFYEILIEKYDYYKNDSVRVNGILINNWKSATCLATEFLINDSWDINEKLTKFKNHPTLAMALVSAMWTSDEINIFQMLLSHRNINILATDDKGNMLDWYLTKKIKDIKHDIKYFKKQLTNYNKTYLLNKIRDYENKIKEISNAYSLTTESYVHCNNCSPNCYSIYEN